MRKYVTICLLMLLFVILYFLRVMQIMRNKENLKNGENIRVSLTITEPILVTGSKQIIKNGELTFITNLIPVYDVGDTIEAVGSVRVKVIGLFNREYILMYPSIQKNEDHLSNLARNKAYPKQIDQLMDDLRQKLVSKIGYRLPEPHGSLLAGIVLGSSSGLPVGFYKDLINTGTIHVVAASGYNITIVANILIYSLTKIVSRKKAIVFSLLGIGFYVILAGGSPSVVRAGIMGGIAYLATFAGREYLAGWGLVVASMLMLLIRPDLVDSVGFWLSVSATGGIVWLARPMGSLMNEIVTNWIKQGWGTRQIKDGKRKNTKHWWLNFSKGFIESLIVTLTAYISTLPIILTVFERLSVISLVVNVMILGLVPVIMALGSSLLLIELIFPTISYLLAWAVWLPLEVFVRLVEMFARISWAVVDVAKIRDQLGVLWWWVFVTGYYCGLVIVAFKLTKLQKQKSE